MTRVPTNPAAPRTVATLAWRWLCRNRAPARPTAHSEGLLTLTEGRAAGPLAAYGWDARFADAFAPYAAEGLAPGRIVRVDRGRCEVVVADGPSVRMLPADSAPLRTPDPVRTPCTGDWAAVDRACQEGPVLRALLPRRTQFLRSASAMRSEGQVLAANIDCAVIALSPVVELDLERLERFLSLAWTSGARPLVVLTKTDLVPDVRFLVEDAGRAAPGVQVLPVSAATGEGLDALAAEFAGRTSVLLGQSGVGKSTLVNALLGRPAQAVAAIRESDGKGRHTTTTRDLLPLPGGGVLIDTPGLRGVGLWEAEQGVALAFAEIDELAADCRFQDCTHEAEPGCAVLAALADGTLSCRRLDSYRKLRRESVWIASRTDARLHAERVAEWKRRTLTGREQAKPGRKQRRTY